MRNKSFHFDIFCGSTREHLTGEVSADEWVPVFPVFNWPLVLWKIYFVLIKMTYSSRSPTPHPRRDIFHFPKYKLFLQYEQLKTGIIVQKMSRDTFIDPLPPPCVIWWHYCEPLPPMPRVSRLIWIALKSKDRESGQMNKKLQI